MTPQPVILLAFSNNRDDYLPMIVEEQKAIKDCLLDHVDKNYLQVRDLQHASTEDLFYLINRYHNQIHLLHYGGHADGNSLQLEKEIGVVQAANAKGIAGLLGTQQSLKLVFLNGCATYGQVKALLDSGVGAVIATRVHIQDQQAQQFATQFYEALATGSSLREAFLKAKAFLETTDDAPEFIELDQSRGLGLRKDAKKEMPWGLYYKPEQEAVLDWKLPSESFLQLDFSGDQVGGRQQANVNTLLVDNLLPAIKDSLYVKELVRMIKRERSTGDPKRKPTDQEKKDTIVRSYPAPVSVNLRELFSQELSQKATVERLRQLLTTYEETVAFFAFMMLSDLWDAALKRRDAFELEENERLQLLAFFHLDERTRRDYDYFLLSDALLRVAKRNGVQFYVEPLNDYEAGWQEVGVLAKAHDHFLAIKTALEGDVPSQSIDAYCLNAEQQLTNVLKEWSFLVHYKMAVVKNIEVQRIRNLPPVAYLHAMVALDNNYNDVGRRDRLQELEAPTDMESVLLYKNRLSDNLNCSPFLLDENALMREYNSKLYFFSHRSEEGLHYFLLENSSDTLVISEDNFGYVLQQFDDARRCLLNETPADKGKAAPTDEDDIISLL